MRTSGWTPFRRLWPQPLVGAGTVALALVALAVAWIRAPGDIGGPATVPVMLLALFLIGALVVANRFPIHIRRKTKVYMTSVPYYQLAVLVPSALAATAAGVGALLGELSVRARRGNSAGDIASEVGRRVSVVLLGALVAHLPGRERCTRCCGWGQRSSWEPATSSPALSCWRR
jgi:hypothetical protein